MDLSKHPQVEFPSETEVHFWDQLAGRSVDDWLRLFPYTDPSIRHPEIVPA